MRIRNWSWTWQCEKSHCPGSGYHGGIGTEAWWEQVEANMTLLLRGVEQWGWGWREMWGEGQCGTTNVGLGLRAGTNVRDIEWGWGKGSHKAWIQYHKMQPAIADGLQSQLTLFRLPRIIPVSSGVCLRLSLTNVLGMMIIKRFGEMSIPEKKMLQAHHSHKITSSLGQFLSMVIYPLLKNFQASLKPGWFSALLMVKNSFLWNWNHLALLKVNSSSLEASTIVSLWNRKHQRQSGVLGYSLKRAVPIRTQLFCLAGHPVNICQLCALCRTLENMPVNKTAWHLLSRIFFIYLERRPIIVVMCRVLHFHDLAGSLFVKLILLIAYWQTRKLKLRELNEFAQRYSEEVAGLGFQILGQHCPKELSTMPLDHTGSL